MTIGSEMYECKDILKVLCNEWSEFDADIFCQKFYYNLFKDFNQTCLKFFVKYIHSMDVFIDNLWYNVKPVLSEHWINQNYV